MDLIPSFTVDHTNLRPGIYVSRTDIVGGQPVTTYDIRMTAPNHEPAMAPSALHTIEHLVAIYLRNHPTWSHCVIYWGPMGCLTGNYLILSGAPTCEQVRQLMIESFEFVAAYSTPVPASTPATCGNCLLHDLPMARWEAARYVNRLRHEFVSTYPSVECPTPVDGV